MFVVWGRPGVEAGSVSIGVKPAKASALGAEGVDGAPAGGKLDGVAGGAAASWSGLLHADAARSRDHRWLPDAGFCGDVSKSQISDLAEDCRAGDAEAVAATAGATGG